MKLTETIRTECLKPRMTLRNKADALAAVAAAAKQCRVLDGVSEEEILRRLRERESLCSTGLGDGVAIPHCRLPGIEEFVVGMITVDKGIDFDAADGKKVRIIAFIIGPESDTSDHPRILSGLSLRLSTPAQREQLIAETTPEGMFNAMKFVPPRDVNTKEHTEKRLVQIVVQEENLFYRILEAIESLEGTAATVLESRNTSEYLTKLPVFASFLTDSKSRFCRVVIATVPKSLTNEILRRIEVVSGGIAGRSDILVIVQDVFLAVGALSI